jgi:hypothetical protein
MIEEILVISTMCFTMVLIGLSVGFLLLKVEGQ